MITLDTENTLTVPVTDKIMYKNIIDFGNDSVVSAEFDFTKLNPKDHEMALQIIGTFGWRILEHKPSQERIEKALGVNETSPKKGFWQKIFFRK